jgi:hypothetical protein
MLLVSWQSCNTNSSICGANSRTLVNENIIFIRLMINNQYHFFNMLHIKKSPGEERVCLILLKQKYLKEKNRTMMGKVSTERSVT